MGFPLIFGPSSKCCSRYTRRQSVWRDRRKSDGQSSPLVSLVLTLRAHCATVILQGYDAGGNFVVGTTDTVTLYIDNTIRDLDLPSVQMGAQTGGDCALFDLNGEPNPAVLTVRFKATQDQGFLSSSLNPG